MSTNIVFRDRTEWGWKDLQDELQNLGGLYGVLIDPRSQKPRFSKTPSFMAGKWQGITFLFSWTKGKFISLSVERASKEILEAFTKLAGRKPFCSYIPTKIMWSTYEWSWVDEKERFEELGNDNEVLELKKI